MRHVITLLPDARDMLADRVAHLAHQYGCDDARELSPSSVYVFDVAGTLGVGSAHAQSPRSTYVRESVERRLPPLS